MSLKPLGLNIDQEVPVFLRTFFDELFDVIGGVGPMHSIVQ